MLDLRDPSASYFNIHYLDLAGDETYVEYVHNINIFGGEERVEIDRCARKLIVAPGTSLAQLEITKRLYAKKLRNVGFPSQM